MKFVNGRESWTAPVRISVEEQTYFAKSAHRDVKYLTLISQAPQTMQLALKYAFTASYNVCFVCLLGFEPAVWTQITFSTFFQQPL